MANAVHGRSSSYIVAAAELTLGTNYSCSSFSAVLLPVTDLHHLPVCETTGTMSGTIDLTGDGGVIKTIVRQAKANALAPSEDLPLVDVHYEGILAETGDVFDTTREDNTVFSFEIGKGTVIKAWDIALRTMKVGEVAKITCKPDFAYGIAGSPPDVPPDATLIFEVELVACKPRKGSSLSSTQDERARLEELRKQRESAATTKEEEKKRREEAKSAAAARIQAKMESKKGQGSNGNSYNMPKQKHSQLKPTINLKPGTAIGLFNLSKKRKIHPRIRMAAMKAKPVLASCHSLLLLKSIHNSAIKSN
ncbi:hypothetical protein Nepgr_032428 [Nepenthes gracilis]|uniref:peptidylprolyl isomerase n=1 Tax=Nepenthes gracilis TaxID=150966 RepID=A0AAD3Y7N6_NEPGR|nr:hypothetical protein Nepgr_032428 [Nepenthes gracilis]